MDVPEVDVATLAAQRAEGASLIDLGDVGHADRAARPHDHVERFREQRAQSEFRDGLFMAAADMHHGDRPIELRHEPLQRRGHRARQRRIAELQRCVAQEVPLISA